MKQRELFIISITVFLTIVAWIIADLFHIATTQKVQFSVKEASQPLDITIDAQVFEALESKR